MRSHANIKKHENDDLVNSLDKLPSQNTRNGISEHQDLKILQKYAPSTP